MDSVWLTSPFVQFGTENLIYNETLCSEAHFLNKFSRDKYKTEKHTPLTINDRRGNFNVLSDYSSKSNLPARRPEQVEEIEENFTLTVNARRETANAVVTGLLKIDSKISLKKAEPKSSLSETNLHSREDSWTRGCKTTESRTIGDALLSCPFELVQIYPGNKENISDLDRTFSDMSREGSSIICFPKEDHKSTVSAAFEKDAPSLSKLKRSHGDSGRNELPLSTIRSQKILKQASVLNAPGYNESNPVDLEKESLQMNTGQDVSSSSSCDDFEKSRSTKGRRGRALKKTEKLTNCLQHETVPVVDTESKTSLTEAADLAKDDRNIEVIPSLEATLCNGDVLDDYTVKSVEGKAKKSARSSSTIIDISGVGWFTGDNTVIDARKTSPEMRGMEEDLGTVAGSGEQETNILNEIMRAADKRNGGNRIVERGIMEYAVDDASSGTIGKDEAKLDVDYGDIKICNLLLIIHKQLYINFQKMENIWIQLQDTSSIDSVRSTVPMRLLVRIISRCKSYIHDSRDSYAAETSIAKTLLGLVIDLAKAVDQNKLVVEKQEQEIDSILLKMYQEKNLYRKRIMINEVVSSWDHGLREICDIMQDILDRLKIVVVEVDEKEDVRNPSFRQRTVIAEWRDLKLNLASRGSNIETRIPAASSKYNPMRQPKSKTSMKSLNTPRSRETEKMGDVVPMKIVERRNNESVGLHRYNATRHPKSRPSTKSLNIQRIRDAEKFPDAVVYKIVERKPADGARCHERGKLLKKPTQSVNFEQWRQMSRQKSRVVNSQQPVWRPGGVVKLPSSSSATTLTQRSRALLPQANEKASQPIEYIKEHPKHGRTGESKKKIGAETYLAKCRTHNSAHDSSKQLSRKCALHPEPAVKYKLKSRPLKVCFKQDSESSCRSESSSPERISRQKNSKEAKVLKLLEDIIKSTSNDKKDKKLGNKSTAGEIEASSTEPVNPISIEEETEIPQDEPTRDIDPDQALTSPKDIGTIRETPQSVQKIPECPLSSVTRMKSQTVESKLDVHLENSQAKNSFNFTFQTSANCTVDLEPSSDCTLKTESSENYRNFINFESLPLDRKRQEEVEDEDDASKNLTMVKEEEFRNSSTINEENSKNPLLNNEEKSKDPSIINEVRSKNLLSINKEISKSLSYINEKRWQNSTEVNEEISKNSLLINEKRLKNPSPVKEEKSINSSTIDEVNYKNLSSVNEENSENLSSINEENSKNLSSINEENSKNPLLNIEEKSKHSSTINNEGSKIPSRINNEGSKIPSRINEEGSKNPSVINDKGSKNPSTIINEGSKNPSTIINEGSKNPSRINDEESKNPSKINNEGSKTPSTINNEASKNPSSINGTASSTSSYTVSLTALKGFLRDQGVDINLLNRAEQCMREKRKCRSCLKTKSASVADVGGCDKHRDKRREPSTQTSRETEILEKIMKICERRLIAAENGRQKPDDIYKNNTELPEKKDTSTSTETKNENTYSQTVPLKTDTKGVQIIEKDTSLTRKREKEAIETQTEIVSTRHTATDYCPDKSAPKIKNIDASSMTESAKIKDSVTETVQVSYVSKMTSTERSESTEKIQNRSRQSATNLTEIWSKMSVRNGQRLTGNSLKKPENSSEKSPTICDQDGGEPDLRESDSSTSTCSLPQFPPCSVNCNCNATMDREFDCFGGMIPWETIANLQSATIRARNMYNAIHSYQQYLETKEREEREKKLAKEECDLEKCNFEECNLEKCNFEKCNLEKCYLEKYNLEKRNLEKCNSKRCNLEKCNSMKCNSNKCNSKKCERKCLSRIDSVDFVVKDSYHSCEYGLETSSRPEMASSNDESECEHSKSASTSITNVSRNGKSVTGAVGARISKKSSSSAVLRDVGSLMDLLIQKIDDAKIEEIDFVQTVSSRTRSKIRIEVSRAETGKTGSTIASYSRQSVLMLVYGVVCSIVFWCLQFTITCDVVA